MQKLIQHFKTGREIISFRLRNHGLATTFLWAYVRLVDFIRGVPFHRYCQITPVLFVGPQYRKAGKRALERWGITASVNMRTEYDDALHGLTFDQYCHLPTVDDQAPTLDQLDRGVEFIGKVLSDGGKVYIHCAGGIGRAPTMAAAYFIHQGMALEEAIELIRRSRPIIRIMPPQLEQLKRFEVLQREAIDESQEIPFRDRETTWEG
jgi:protein-tyrosine phosphatase